MATGTTAGGVGQERADGQMADQDRPSVQDKHCARVDVWLVRCLHLQLYFRE